MGELINIESLIPGFAILFLFIFLFILWYSLNHKHDK